MIRFGHKRAVPTLQGAGTYWSPYGDCGRAACAAIALLRGCFRVRGRRRFGALLSATFRASLLRWCRQSDLLELLFCPADIDRARVGDDVGILGFSEQSCKLCFEVAPAALSVLLCVSILLPLGYEIRHGVQTLLLGLLRALEGYFNRRNCIHAIHFRTPGVKHARVARRAQHAPGRRPLFRESLRSKL